MSDLVPTAEQLKEVSELPDEGPVVMLNLLKFKPNGGAESYVKYARATEKIINDLGGQLVYLGRAEASVIGRDEWDLVMLVRYPSRAAFLKMGMDPKYQETAHFRTEALTDSRLIATKQLADFRPLIEEN